MSVIVYCGAAGIDTDARSATKKTTPFFARDEVFFLMVEGIIERKHRETGIIMANFFQIVKKKFKLWQKCDIMYLRNLISLL